MPRLNQQPASAPGSDPFIVLTSAKPDKATRKRIRRHVMLGKNRKEKKTAAVLGSWINDSLAIEREIAREQTPQLKLFCLSSAEQLATVDFVEKIQPAMLGLMAKWFHVMQDAMYPIEACVQPSATSFVQFLRYDHAFLHSVLFAASAFSDFLGQGKFSRLTISHMNLCIHHLQQSLASKEAATADSTIKVVVVLALFSDVLGDREAALKHMQGLQQMIRIRGGIRGLSGNGQLQAKVCRADIALAISSGNKPAMFPEGFSWDPYLAPRGVKTCTPPRHVKSSNQSTTPLHALISNPDKRLLNIYYDLSEFSRAANLAHQTGRKINPDNFHETLVSVQYRLLALQHDDTFSPLESFPERFVRLGMLAYTTATFCQIRAIPIKFPDLERKLRGCLSDLAGEEVGSYKGTKEFDKVQLWFVMVAYVSIFWEVEADREVLAAKARELVSALGLEMKEGAWGEVRGVLREWMWVDFLHDEYGRKFWRLVVGGGECRRG